MLIDLRDALRGLRAGRGTTVLALVILAVTLAAGTITFSVVDVVALRSLPYSDSDRLVAIAYLPRPGGVLGGTSPQDFFSWRESTRSFEALAGAWVTGVVRINSNGGMTELRSGRVTPNLFEVLGVQPAFGRLFRPEEETPGHNTVLVLTHSAWTGSFGRDPAVIGRRVEVTESRSTATYEIVGVLPPGITYPMTAGRAVEIFRPYVATAAEHDHTTGRSYGLHVVGRLRPHVTLDQARADVERVNRAVRLAYPATLRKDASTVVLSLHDRVVGPAKSWLLLVLAAVSCVVLIGCVNAASLLLVRATVRQRELATRAALGASRGRLARTLLLEGVLVACIAAAGAILLSYWGLDFAKSTLPANLARASTIAIDARVLMASICAALLCGLVAGGTPAWRVLRREGFEHMKVVGAIVGGSRHGPLSAFLVAEVAFVTLLLVATTLVVTSFVMITTTDLGFDRKNVMTISLSDSLPTEGTMDRQATAAVFFDDVLRRVRAVPGVAAAGLISSGSTPLARTSVRYSVEIPAAAEPRRVDMFEMRGVSPEYFSAVQMRLLSGRSFGANDSRGAPAVAIINEFAARRYFAGREPIGEVITFREKPTRIVGVVQNVRWDGPEAAWRNELYVPLAQEPAELQGEAQQLVVRTDLAARTVAQAVRDAIRPALTGRDVPNAQFVSDDFWRLTADRRFNAGLMSALGMMSLLIGALGVYGTMAFLVTQDARAIGLKMALGASQSSVLQGILSTALTRVVLGALLGLVGARIVANVLTSLVFGIQTTSAALYASVGVGVAAIGVLAAWIPARRAARLDPLAALRME